MALRVGLIGCGGAAWVHIRGWLSLGARVRFVGLADPDVTRRRNLHRHIEQHRSGPGVTDELAEFDDYHELLEKAKADAVDILLPHHLHKDCIVTACRRKAHWLCEKPLGLTYDDAEEIRGAMKSASVTGMCAHNQLFMPALVEAKRLLAEGHLGQIYTVISQGGFIMGQPAPGAVLPNGGPQSPIETGPWRTDPVKMGGGELIDSGYHPCYRLLYLAGEKPEGVVAVTARHRLTKLPAEDSALVVCRFPGGATGLVRTSWAMEVPAGHHPFHVIGENGELYGGSSELCFQPNRMQPARMQFPEVDTFMLQIRHFVDCVETGRKPVQTYEDGIAVLDLILRAYESTRQSQMGVRGFAADMRSVCPADQEASTHA